MFLRKIKDIKIINNEISTIRDASISVTELENQISKLRYSGVNRTKDPIVENTILPPFIQVFYYHFFAYLRIPKEEEAFETYVSWLGGSHNNQISINGEPYSLDSVKHRFLRTYPSLIRDLHFIYLLRESQLFEQIEYSMEKDYLNGIDLKITHKGTVYFLSLFIDTDRSKYFKQKKRYRHDYSQINEIELKVHFSELSLIGDIYLLNSTHVQLLKELIIKE